MGFRPVAVVDKLVQYRDGKIQKEEQHTKQYKYSSIHKIERTNIQTRKQTVCQYLCICWCCLLKIIKSTVTKFDWKRLKTSDANQHHIYLVVLLWNYGN